MRRHLRKPTIYPSLAATLVLVLGSAAATPAAVVQAHTPGMAAPAYLDDRGDDPLARAAREVNLQETGHLHAIGEPGTTIIERGDATGTFNCSIAGRLTIVSANKVTATFTVKPRGGSITGRGSARFAQQGANGYFGGTISITSGTGSYAHTAGTNIGISGVISRETFALTVHVHGKIHV
jgi:hypothetical protein